MLREVKWRKSPWWGKEGSGEWKASSHSDRTLEIYIPGRDVNRTISLKAKQVLWTPPVKSFPIPFLWEQLPFLWGQLPFLWGQLPSQDTGSTAESGGNTVSMGSIFKKLELGLRLPWQSWSWLPISHPGSPDLITRITIVWTLKWGVLLSDLLFS